MEENGESWIKMAPNFRKIITEQEEKIKTLEKLVATHEELEKAIVDKIKILEKQAEEQDAAIRELSKLCKQQQDILDQVAEETESAEKETDNADEGFFVSERKSAAKGSGRTETHRVLWTGSGRRIPVPGQSCRFSSRSDRMGAE